VIFIAFVSRTLTASTPPAPGVMGSKGVATVHTLIFIRLLKGGGCRNRACQVRSWSSEEAGLDLDTGGRLDRLHIRVHLWWVSRWARRLLVVTGARCPLTKPVVAAVELQAATGPHCSRGLQPGGICVYVGAARADSRRPQALPMPAAALVLYLYFHSPPSDLGRILAIGPFFELQSECTRR
jgi:hypothetical protein